LDIGRLGDMLRRIKGHITHRALDHISPLAVPVMLEIGKEPVRARRMTPFWPKPPTT
jgi:ATP-dependent Lhr-like helicase